MHVQCSPGPKSVAPGLRVSPDASACRKNDIAAQAARGAVLLQAASSMQMPQAQLHGNCHMPPALLLPRQGPTGVAFSLHDRYMEGRHRMKSGRQ